MDGSPPPRVQDRVLERALALEPVDGRWRAILPPESSNGPTTVDPLKGGPVGGYLAGLALEAARAGLKGEAAPRAVSVQYLSRPDFAPLDLEVEALRDGRSVAFARVTARQGADTPFAAEVTFGAPGKSPEHRPSSAPAVKPPEDLADLALPEGAVPHFTRWADYKPAGGGFPFAGGDEARILIWMRMKDARPLTDARLAFLFDAIFPAFYATVTAPAPAVSVDLRYDFAGPISDDAAPDGWALFEFTTRDFADGWAVEDATAWNRNGRALGFARQVRKVLGRTARVIV